MAMSQSHPECRIVLFTSASETEMSLCPDLGTACTQWTREPSTHTAVRLWLASVLTHCPAGKALCSGSPPAHLGPSAYPALARPLSTGIFSPLPPLHIATAYVLPNLSASTTVPSRDSCCHASHTSGQTSWRCQASLDQLRWIITSSRALWFELLDIPRGASPQPSYLPGRSGFVPIADTCCWDPCVPVPAREGSNSGHAGMLRNALRT